MAVNTVFFKNSSLIDQLTRMRTTFDDLQRQLATQKNSTTYAGLGQNRSLDLALKQRISEIGSYQQTGSFVDLRLNVIDKTISRMDEIRSEARKAMDPNNFVQQADGATNSQTSAEVSLVELLGLLNTDVAGRHVYSGSKVDTAPVVDMDLIMNGDLTHAGLKQVIDEYVQADAGPLNNGRLTSSLAGTTVTLAEDGAHNFGFKIAGVTSDLSNVTTNYTGGPPASQDIDFAGQPEVGETIKVYLDMPDGTQTSVELKVADGPGVKNGFELGATPADTAANMQAALDTALQGKASSDLKAASHYRASEAFFDTYQGQEVPRVDGPPFDTATATRPGGADTVAWYVGDQTVGNPRDGASAVIDDNFEVKYGARANEDGIREVVQSIAAFVAADFSGESEENHEFYSAMAERARSPLQNTEGKTSGIQKIEMEMATTHLAVKRVEERHKTMANSLQTSVDEIEGIDKNEVAAQILQLQTMMEMSYRTTSIMYQLSLANYL
ncbi:flagellar protein [Breoghania sp.]|uniref:flagellar protein n=1 Tax=Breoghania sp. TaxID=2065378 RepID=UPI0029CA8E3C|nr:flagellar protein [Breoghania sp.]